MSFPLATHISIATSTFGLNPLQPRSSYWNPRWSEIPKWNTAPGTELMSPDYGSSVWQAGFGTINENQILTHNEGNSFSRIIQTRGRVELVSLTSDDRSAPIELVRLPRSSQATSTKATIKFPKTPDGELRIILNKTNETEQSLHKDQPYQAPAIVFRRVEQVLMNANAKKRQFLETEPVTQNHKRIRQARPGEAEFG